MKIRDAEHIIEVVRAALEDSCDSCGHHPISALQGHDMFDILVALKLRIANELLLLRRRPDGEEQFAAGLKLYDSIPWQIMRSFVADDQVGQIDATLVFSPINRTTMKFDDARLASQETGTSFGDYCRTVGAEDQNYWRHVYRRIGIEYTADSPRGNLPVT